MGQENPTPTFQLSKLAALITTPGLSQIFDIESEVQS